ncbi:MAG: phosphate ABC transporter substrate-binding/OmpA family protein [Bacteroidota bacterium]
MAKTKLTPLSKILITLLVAGGVGFGAYKTGLLDYIAPKGKGAENVSNVFSDEDEVIRVGVVTWGGYAGGEYFNEGFKASKESRFYKDYGILVEFVLNDDFVSSREAWKAGKVDVLWATIDAFPTEVASFAEFEPQVIFQADWSRGGDAIVARRGIKTVADLKGKKVAVAPMTPSHTFLLWLLDAGDLSYNDIEIVEAPNAIDAAAYFKAGRVDAAVVWSPDDEDCVSSVKGASILKNTKVASNIIADVFFVKKEYLEKNRKALGSLVEGWMKGAAEINASETNKKKAAKILAEGLNVDEGFALNAINNARLCTYGDNVNFYNLAGNFEGVKGEDIYTRMGQVYNKLNLAPDNLPAWRTVSNSSLIKNINLAGKEHTAEAKKTSTPVTAELKKTKAFSSKSVSITFPTGAFKLDENAKYIIDLKLADLAKAFANARIRIEGNTDNVGNAANNKALSLKRAQAVAEYLEKEHNFDPNRFVIVGNGPDKPVADNNTEEGRAKNRRTEFQLLNN